MKNVDKNQPKFLTLQELQSRQITSLTEVPEEIPLVTVNGSLFCKVGGISVIMGKPKAGKSTVMETILTLTFNNGQLQSYDNLEFDVAPAEQKNVVIIDTEQSKGDVKDAVQRVKKNLKLTKDPENLHYFYLRQDDIVYRRLFLHSILEAIPNIHFIIIDGFADMVKDPVTAVTDCKEFVAEILAYSDKYGIGIIGAIHQNFDNFKSTGHLGSELEKKANGILQVEKKNDVHIISTNALRKAANFEPIHFKRGNDGTPYQVDKSEVGSYASKKKESEKINELKDTVKRCFTKDDKTLLTMDKKEFQQMLNRVTDPNYDLSDRKEKDATRKKAGRVMINMFEHNLIDTNGSPEKLKPNFTI
jgi:hypothetical protein